MKNFCNNPRFMGGSAGVPENCCTDFGIGGRFLLANGSVRKNVHAEKQNLPHTLKKNALQDSFYVTMKFRMLVQ